MGGWRIKEYVYVCVHVRVPPGMHVEIIGQLSGVGSHLHLAEVSLTVSATVLQTLG